MKKEPIGVEAIDTEGLANALDYFFSRVCKTDVNYALLIFDKKQTSYIGSVSLKEAFKEFMLLATLGAKEEEVELRGQDKQEMH
jgi:hypothetical protein